MIKNINFESNCKRLVKYINKHCADVDVLISGRFVIKVSETLRHEFDDNRKKYVKEINKLIDWGSISKGIATFDEFGQYLVLDVEYDDIDEEMEDW